jgi:hypothetical protein
VRKAFEVNGGKNCPGETDCADRFQTATDTYLQEFDGGVVVDIGRYGACLDCEKLKTKPLVELRRMAEVVPSPLLAEYQTNANLEALVDQIEALAERHLAGWLVDFNGLDEWEAELLVFWLTLERHFTRQLQIATVEVTKMAAQISAMKKAF